MAAKSRYQMVNRGSRREPYWRVEDAEQGGKAIYTSSRRSSAEGFLKMTRRLQAEHDAALKAGYHMPGGRP